MTIYNDTENDKTIFTCDSCGSVGQNDRANGVIDDDWMTGQLWIDESLSKQTQIPLCFCPDCSRLMLSRTGVTLTFSQAEETE